MKHRMNLAPQPFEMIADGTKTIELRLYDEKRRGIGVGDEITFVHTESKEEIRAKVIALHLFDSFKELYHALPLLKCGYTEADVASARPSDMDVYYTAEQQEQYGVVGIEIAVIGGEYEIRN